MSSTIAGLVNAHTHVYSGLAPFGMPAPAPRPRNFVEILERVWWRLDRALDLRSLGVSARYYVADALLHGTTVLVDHHESPSCIEGSLDVIAEACEALGMRAVLCYGATERNGGPDEARRGLDECRRFILSNRRPLVRGVVGLHASFTVSDDTVSAAARMCAALGSVLHVHVAEDVADVEDAKRRGFAGPLERLLALRALPPGSILAHGVHLSVHQVSRAMDAGCWIVQNPRSNRNNAVGYPSTLGRAPRVALGTDGFAADMVEERRELHREGVAHGEDGPVLDERCTGSLRLAAECLGLAVEPPPPGESTEAWLTARAASARQSLHVEGRSVIEGGRLMTGDFDAITADAQAEAVRLWDRLGQ